MRKTLLIDAVALLVAIAVAIGIFRVAEYRKQSMPIGDWFEVRQFYIPDFAVGDDPLVLLDVAVTEKLASKTVIAIRDLTMSARSPADCIVTSKVNLSPEQNDGIKAVTLSSLLGNAKCTLGEGEHVMEITWAVERDGYEPATVNKISNIFTVIPRGAQRYITEEEQMKIQQAE